MKVKKLSLYISTALLTLSGAAGAAPLTLPSVTVSSVTATSPVLRTTSGIDVTATVNANFDQDNSTPSTNFSSCNNGDNFCGTGDNTVKSKKVVTTISTSVTNRNIKASAADPNSSSELSLLQNNTYKGTLSTPTAGSDGNNTVTVTAAVSETITTCTTTTTSYWTGPNGSGTQVGSTTQSAPTCDGGTLKTADGSASRSYVLDINPPILTLRPDQSQPSVLQGENKNIHNVLIGGSAGKPYTLTDSVTGPDNYTSSANGSGTFGPSNDGIAPNEHDLVGVHIACNAPIGAYTASAAANTVDLGDSPYNSITSQDYVDNKGNDSGGAIATFEVLPGIFLEDQTTVVSELPPSGDYAPMTCFKAGTSGKKIATLPGSLHLTATVNTTGPCNGFGTISGTVVTLTLPEGFSFDTTGASPAAHVFIGPAESGFDFHYPQTLAEVTNLIPKQLISISGQTVTVNLSTLNLGNGPGVIPSSDTIYVRAHAIFSGNSVPVDGTTFAFTTSTTSNLPGGIGSTTNSSSQEITASSACQNGN